MLNRSPYLHKLIRPGDATMSEADFQDFFVEYIRHQRLYVDVSFHYLVHLIHLFTYLVHIWYVPRTPKIARLRFPTQLPPLLSWSFRLSSRGYRLNPPILQCIDYLHTLPLEITHVWYSRWTYTKILFLLTRYVPLINIIFLLHSEYPHFAPSRVCELGWNTNGLLL